MPRSIPEECRDDLNELLADAPPHGAFAMGIALSACMKAGTFPSRTLLEAMRNCRSTDEAMKDLNIWIGLWLKTKERSVGREGGDS